MQRAAPTLRAVLLDVDGTLVDSNDAHAHAWVEAMQENGFEVDFARVRSLIGMGADKLLPAAIGIAPTSADGERIVRRRGQIFRHRMLAEVTPFPRVRALLERLRAGNLELVVASSADRRELEALLAVAGVADLVSAQTSADDAEHSKPDPDLVEIALARARARAQEALFLGDTPYDVLAGERTGVGVVALRCGGWNDEALGGATAIYDDPLDLLEHFDRSPFARRGA